MRMKRWIISVLSVLLIGVTVLVAAFEVAEDKNTGELDLLICVESDGRPEYLRPWKNENGDFYVFLPGYAQLDAVSLICERGTAIIDGMEPSRKEPFALNRAYSIAESADGEMGGGTITFLKSDGIPTMYIDTFSGNMEYIHMDKNNEESGTLRLYDLKGNSLYSGELTSIKGRGNTSWHAEKKPYNLTFAEAADVLGMGAARRWVLLAEGYNDLNIRNKIVYDFAASAGNLYSPNCKWVDLYLNGEYTGLYLISERNEIHPNRIDIEADGSIVVSLEYESSLVEQSHPYIVTEAGQALRIRHGEADYSMQKKWQSIENAILSENSVDPTTQTHLEELIDLDSWVRKYLIEEIFANMDAGSLSQYYYCDGADPQGKIYAGPVWDYDFGMGGEDVWLKHYTDFFTANRKYVNDHVYTPWYSALCSKDFFIQRTRELYEQEYLPLLNQLIDSGISDYAKSIIHAASVDCVRWGGEASDAENEIEYIHAFLKKRVDFLTDYWINDSEYHTVCVDLGRYGLYGYFAVKNGESLPVLPDAQELGGIGWYTSDSQEPYDVTSPVYEDVHIYMKKAELQTPIIHYFPIVTLATILLIMLLLDGLQVKKSRGEMPDAAKSR